MKRTLLRAIAASAVAAARSAVARIRPASSVQPACGSSAPALAALLADWKGIGFGTPSKPAQHRVYGRKGHVTDGPTYNAMVTLIRLALKDSRTGRDEEALAKVAKVRSLLGQ
jgi:hypothetical protein